RIPLAGITDIVHAEKHPRPGDGQQRSKVMTISEVANHDPVWRNAFFAQQSDLFESQLAEVGSVGGYCHAGQALRPRRCTKHALLAWSYEFSFRADLSDETGAHISAINADCQLFDNSISEGVRVELTHELRVHLFAVPGGSHYHVNTGSFGDAAHGARVAAKAAARTINERAAARLAVV